MWVVVNLRGSGESSEGENEEQRNSPKSDQSMRGPETLREGVHWNA